MSDHSKHRHGPGPLGTATNSPTVDRGTLAVTAHKAPGPLGHHSLAPSPWEIEVKKLEYLEYARGVSYLMQGKSAAESTESWVLEQLKKAAGSSPSKPKRVQSFLGGAFLRMYLDGKSDPAIIAMAGVEIGESPEFQRLTEDLTKFLQKSADHAGPSGTDPAHLQKIADAHLKGIKSTKGIAFRYTLNAVIGGVTGVEVRSVTPLGDAASPHGIVRRYRVDINFSDTYDFANQRTGEYDRYRKELAHDLLADDFEKFESVYSREAHHPFDTKMHATHLDQAAVFASFMYALEQKGWTPGGLKWDVTVSAEIKLTLKPAARAARHH